MTAEMGEAIPRARQRHRSSAETQASRVELVRILLASYEVRQLKCHNGSSLNLLDGLTTETQFSQYLPQRQDLFSYRRYKSGQQIGHSESNGHNQELRSYALRSDKVKSNLR